MVFNKKTPELHEQFRGLIVLDIYSDSKKANTAALSPALRLS